MEPEQESNIMRWVGMIIDRVMGFDRVLMQDDLRFAEEKKEEFRRDNYRLMERIIELEGDLHEAEAIIRRAAKRVKGEVDGMIRRDSEMIYEVMKKIRD